MALLDPGSGPADALGGPAAASTTAHAAGTMPRVHSRAEWGADESIRFWDPEFPSTIKAATIHHSADGNNYTAAQVPAMLRSIYAYHTQTRGWGDIGYNVIVDKFGRIFEGRYGGLTSTVVGAHAGGFNTFTFGVSMLGNYDLVQVPQVTVNAVSEIIAWKLGLYGVDPRGSTVLTSGGGGTARYAAGQRVTLPTVFGHRDVGSTACPGQYGYARLGEIRERVNALVGAVGRTLLRTPESAAVYVVSGTHKYPVEDLGTLAALAPWGPWATCRSSTWTDSPRARVSTAWCVHPQERCTSWTPG
ncbi:N-acetylmuramoyl-L-alanine amidase [Blastococcus brunescens]|uniref:N-acetylmuramoyl-L-alanine amidase n=1 Tax=Blastococcus brunescens TaxID=1564165 RepID=A0ABZ1AWJ3_9ACTN|nr:N-acetylmuramoyl-L-alanine amidase [Blastococcus sp. BMG 8361]WRL62932.1 N-acetylmuramoyl-L-alanine amidase [Blastococcus sp. BMG 8361]